MFSKILIFFFGEECTVFGVEYSERKLFCDNATRPSLGATNIKLRQPALLGPSSSAGQVAPDRELVRARLGACIKRDVAAANR